jgi:hypothetical protein
LLTAVLAWRIRARMSQGWRSASFRWPSKIFDRNARVLSLWRPVVFGLACANAVMWQR